MPAWSPLCNHGAIEVPYFPHRHLIALDETNATGNVYFAHYVKWQGHCREAFLRSTAEWVVTELGERYGLVTTDCECRFLSELHAFDEVCIHMGFRSVRRNRMTLEFEYWKASPGTPELCARGRQTLAWLERDDDAGLRPRPVPAALLEVIATYSLTGGRAAGLPMNQQT
jgi:enediyne biosynthesis thioesterase